MRRTIGLSLALLVASPAAMAKPAQPGQDQPAPSKSKSAKAATPEKKTARKDETRGKQTARDEKRNAATPNEGSSTLPPPDRLVYVQPSGNKETGSAVWYGGRHLGHRTASGDRLDDIRPTAAHRSLPLNSLVKVTNLGNGKSIICQITDRGPVSRNRLIDVSPRVADVLDMKRSGIARVTVEPVAVVQYSGNSPAH